jgi:adhesin transport system membrane fusion protein
MSRRSSSVAMAERVANPNRASSILLLSIFLSFLAFFVWAALWEIEEATLAEGRIVPSAKVQVVQSLEGGIVKTIHVRQGDSVKEGDLLVSLSTAQAGSDYECRRQQALALSARVVRLTAEVEDKGVTADGQPAAEFVIATADVARDKNRELLLDLCDAMTDGSLCALGGLTPMPVLSALTHFSEDFERKAPARQAAEQVRP